MMNACVHCNGKENMIEREKNAKANKGKLTQIAILDRKNMIEEE